jgi:AraC-like DNA-binding protein
MNDIENNIPQVDLPVDFIVSDNVPSDILNLYGRFPCKIKAGIFAFVSKGIVRATVNLKEYVMKENTFITLLPNSFIQIHEVSADGLVCFAGFSAEFLDNMTFIKSISNMAMDIMDNPTIELDEDGATLFKDVFSVLTKGTDDKNKKLFEGCTQSVLDIFVHTIINMYTNFAENEKPKLVREKEIAKEFIQLVWQNYTKEHGASFYADQLRITLPHFCSVIKKATGKTPLDLIAHIIILDAKAQLKSTSLSVKEIAINLGYNNVAFFDKYFKRYVGITPLEYRNS